MNAHLQEEQLTRADDLHLPRAQHAEEQVAGGLLLWWDRHRDAFLQLSVSDFYVTTHQIIFRACGELEAQGKLVDTTTVADHLAEIGKLEEAGGIPYFAELQGKVITDAKLPAYIQLVKEASCRRRAVELGNRIMRQAQDGAAAFGEVLADAQRDVTALQQEQAEASGAAQTVTVISGPVFQTSVTEPARYLIGAGPEDGAPTDEPAGLWAADGKGLLLGPARVGKTTVGCELAVSICTGTRLFGHFAVAQGRVLFAVAEDSRGRIQRRLEAAFRARGIDEWPDTLALCFPDVPGGLRVGSKGWDVLRASARDLEPNLIIGDPLAALYPTDYNENDNNHGARLAEEFSLLAQEAGNAAQELTHHRGKPSLDTRGRTAGEGARGNSAFYAAMTESWTVTPKRDHRFTITAVSKDSPPLLPFEVGWQQGRLVWLGVGEDDEAAKERLLALVESLGPEQATTRRISEELTLSREAARQKLGKLEQEGRLQRLPGMTAKWQVIE